MLRALKRAARPRALAKERRGAPRTSETSFVGSGGWRKSGGGRRTSSGRRRGRRRRGSSSCWRGGSGVGGLRCLGLEQRFLRLGAGDQFVGVVGGAASDARLHFLVLIQFVDCGIGGLARGDAWEVIGEQV